MSAPDLFISDSHFGHARIVEYCDRPFASTDEMNATMIKRWNQAVTDDSQIIWHLGDFGFGPIDFIREVRAQLKGTIHLIIGNHDRYPQRKYLDAGFTSAAKSYRLQTANGAALLRHHPLASNDRWPPGIRMVLCGHIHNKPGWWETSDSGVRMYNCSVELLDYRPVTLTNLFSIHQKRKQRMSKVPKAEVNPGWVPALNQGIYLPR